MGLCGHFATLSNHKTHDPPPASHLPPGLQQTHTCRFFATLLAALRCSAGHKPTNSTSGRPGCAPPAKRSDMQTGGTRRCRMHVPFRLVVGYPPPSPELGQVLAGSPDVAHLRVTTARGSLRGTREVNALGLRGPHSRRHLSSLRGVTHPHGKHFYVVRLPLTPESSTHHQAERFEEVLPRPPHSTIGPGIPHALAPPRSDCEGRCIGQFRGGRVGRPGGEERTRPGSLATDEASVRNTLFLKDVPSEMPPRRGQVVSRFRVSLRRCETGRRFRCRVVQPAISAVSNVLVRPEIDGHVPGRA